MPATHNRRSSRSSSRPRLPRDITDLDRARYLRFCHGVTIEEQATQERIRVSAIRDSVERVKLHNSRYSAEEAEVALRKVGMNLLPESDRVLREGLSAESIRLATHIDPDSGEVKVIEHRTPDIQTRLKAHDKVVALIEAVQPKVPAFQLNQQFNSSQQQLPSHGHQALSFESIVRQIRQERGLALPAEVAADHTEEAIVVGEVDMELEEELAEDEEDEEEGDGDEEPPEEEE